MKKPQQELIRYRLGRAQESLEEAHLLATNSHWNTCINRLYYACFYAVNALLLTKGLSSARHAGVRALFNQNFVKQGAVSKELAACYNDLFESRQETDYEDLFQFDSKAIPPLIEQAKQFVKAISWLIEQSQTKF